MPTPATPRTRPDKPRAPSPCPRCHTNAHGVNQAEWSTWVFARADGATIRAARYLTTYLTEMHLLRGKK